MAKKKQPKATDLEGVIRHKMQAEVQRRGLSLYELANEAGVTPGQLSRFDRAERSLSLETASKLCEVLGLVLVERDLIERILHEKDT